ncbi:MAG: hypothetical protein GYB67_03875 [Chloroflexi bacterium]|nr:hypothetical protein [Chloroflexota bacterium]
MATNPTLAHKPLVQLPGLDGCLDLYADHLTLRDRRRLGLLHRSDRSVPLNAVTGVRRAEGKIFQMHGSLSIFYVDGETEKRLDHAYSRAHQQQASEIARVLSAFIGGRRAHY